MVSNHQLKIVTDSEYKIKVLVMPEQLEAMRLVFEREAVSKRWAFS